MTTSDVEYRRLPALSDAGGCLIGRACSGAPQGAVLRGVADVQHHGSQLIDAGGESLNRAEDVVERDRGVMVIPIHIGR